jgi:hypothetical protein
MISPLELVVDMGLPCAQWMVRMGYILSGISVSAVRKKRLSTPDPSDRLRTTTGTALTLQDKTESWHRYGGLPMALTTPPSESAFPVLSSASTSHKVGLIAGVSIAVLCW